MKTSIPIPALSIEPCHIKAVRLYLSDLYGLERPVSQADMATLTGCISSNTYARWERQSTPPPVMLLRCLQAQIHIEHLRRDLYRSDQQSLELFLSFYASLSERDKAPAAPGYSSSMSRQTIANRILYEAAWEFDGPFVDGLTLQLAPGPLTLSMTPAFGEKKKLRPHGIFLLDKFIRHESESDMSELDKQSLHERLRLLAPERPDDELQSVDCGIFDVQVRGNTLSFVINDADRKALLVRRFADAGRQAEMDAATPMTRQDSRQLWERILSRCDGDPATDGCVVMRNFIGTDKRAKFLQVAHLERALRLGLNLPTPAPQNLASHQLWMALRNGQTACTTELLILALVGRNLTITFTSKAMPAVLVLETISQ